MSWAKYSKEALARGETVEIRPKGNSMRGRINSGDLVTIEPCDPANLVPGDIVLVRVSGTDYVHLVSARDGERIQISNNHGHLNGWVGPRAVYGIVTRVSP